VGKKLTCIVRDFPFAIVVATPEKPVCVNGYVSVTAETLNDVVPVFVMVTAWVGLALPRDWLANANKVVFKLAIAVVLVPTPPNVTFWEGKPVIVTVSVPLKVLARFGLKVTEKLAHCAGWIVTGNVPVGTN
jgi:hypothetical protein